MDIQKYLEVKFSKHYEDYIGETPTKEQLKVYMDFCLEKEEDPKKTAEVFEIMGFRDGIEASLGRDKRKKQFEAMFGFEPNEDQLDVFIASCFYGVGNQEDMFKYIFYQDDLSEETQNEPANN